MLADMILEVLADARLAPQLDSSVDERVLNEALGSLFVAFRVIFTWQEILFDEISDLDVLWRTRLVLELARLNVFNKKLRSQQPPSGELIQTLGPCFSHKLSPLTWKLLIFVVAICSELLELFLKERLVKVDEHLIVAQISLIFCIVNLLDVVLELLLSRVLIRQESRHVLEEVFNLFLLADEFAVLDVQVEDAPDVGRRQVRHEQMLIVLRHIGHVLHIASEVPERLRDLLLNGLDTRSLEV